MLDLAIAGPLSFGSVSAQSLRTTVVSIGDGDILLVRDGNNSLNVSLACIDALESRQTPRGANAGTQFQDPAPVGTDVELRLKITTGPAQRKQ